MMGIMEKCSKGCVLFHGGEIRHTKGCVFYPESLTEYNLIKQENLTKRYIEAEKFISDGIKKPWYSRFFNKSAISFLSSRSKYNF